MSNTFSHFMNKKLVLSLNKMIIGASAIFGFTLYVNPAFADTVCVECEFQADLCANAIGFDLLNDPQGFVEEITNNEYEVSGCKWYMEHLEECGNCLPDHPGIEDIKIDAM